jgi:hypothetical protein
LLPNAFILLEIGDAIMNPASTSKILDFQGKPCEGWPKEVQSNPEHHSLKRVLKNRRLIGKVQEEAAPISSKEGLTVKPITNAVKDASKKFPLGVQIDFDGGVIRLGRRYGFQP